MKTSVKTIIGAAAIILASQAVPVHAGVNFNLSIGIPAVVAAVPPPPLPAPRRVVIEEDPEFVYSPELGFYVSVGTPVDIYYADGNYYRNDRGYWYCSPRHNGGWARVHSRRLPHQIARYRYDQIRYFRDRECRDHMDHRHDRWRDRHDRFRGDGKFSDRERFQANYRNPGDGWR